MNDPPDPERGTGPTFQLGAINIQDACTECGGNVQLDLQGEVLSPASCLDCGNEYLPIGIYIGHEGMVIQTDDEEEEMITMVDA